MGRDIRSYCISKWSANKEDVRVKYFWENYYEFRKNLSEEMGLCVDRLLEEFNYYSQSVVNKDFVSLHWKLISTYKIDIDYTVFAVLKSQKGTYNSSYEYIGEYKNLNKVSKNNVFPDISDCFGRVYWPFVKNVVFIDDFCGSGKTFIDYLLSILEFVKGKTIYYVVIHSMGEAEKRINHFAKDNNLKVNLVAEHMSNAAFSEIEDLQGKKELFIEESKLLGIRDSEILGFSNSESLVAFHENTPNNTLGVFMKDTEKNTALFPRKIDSRPVFMEMKAKRERKKTNNYVCRSRSRNG